MLQELTIENLRGIRQGTIRDFSLVNILIGPNGCGKSTILESIVLLACPYSRSDPLARPDSYPHDKNVRINRDYLMANKRNSNSLYSSLPWYRDETKLTVKGLFEFGPISVTHIKPSGSPSDSNNPSNNDIVKYMERLYFIDTDLALKRHIEDLLWKEAFLQKLRTEIQNHFGTIYGRKVEALSYTTDGDLLVESDPCPLRLDSHGAGMRIGFRILLAALMSNGSTLLLEEFDAYQHKTSLERLALALCEIADSRKTQIIMTTHSLETVHAFVTAAQPLNKDLVRIFPLELDESGILRTHGMKGEDAANLMASGMDLRDITTYAK
jgi:AAA15 family ATPase/GTPase